MTRKEFISKLAPLAVADMKRTGVPASLTIAQGILESADGNSGLTIRANNLFGIKGIGPAGSLTMPTKEFSGGKWITINAPFRKYNNWGESVADHSALLVSGVSWNRNLYKGVLGVDGRTAARSVAVAGYATDPNYADKLLSLMDTWNLYQYDIKEEENEMSPEDANKIIRFLSAAWNASESEEARNEFNRLANELRKVSGQPAQ